MPSLGLLRKKAAWYSRLMLHTKPGDIVTITQEGRTGTVRAVHRVADMDVLEIEAGSAVLFVLAAGVQPEAHDLLRRLRM